MHNTADHGQHLLVDKTVIDQMVQSVNEGDLVLEIGPGTGEITKALLQKKARVVAIEVDRSYERYLARFHALEVIYGDVLEIGFPKFEKLVSNLPFHITEPFIEKLARVNFVEAILLVGGKFAKEAMSKPGDEHFGKMSLVMQCYFKCEHLAEVKKGSFDPPPRVTAALIRLVPFKPKDFSQRVMRELFDQRDKKLKNALREAIVRICGVTKNQARETIDEMGLPESWLEGNLENLSNEDFVILTHRFGGFENVDRD